MYMCNEERGMEHSVVQTYTCTVTASSPTSPVIYTFSFLIMKDSAIVPELVRCYAFAIQRRIAYSTCTAHHFLTTAAHTGVFPPSRSTDSIATRSILSDLQTKAASVFPPLSCAPVTRDSGATSKELLGVYQKHPSQHPGSEKSLPRLAHTRSPSDNYSSSIPWNRSMIRQDGPGTLFCSTTRSTMTRDVYYTKSKDSKQTLVYRLQLLSRCHGDTYLALLLTSAIARSKVRYHESVVAAASVTTQMQWPAEQLLNPHTVISKMQTIEWHFRVGPKVDHSFQNQQPSI